MSLIDNIKEEIINHPKIKRYKQLEEIINKNQEVKNLLNESKDIQKQIVHAEALQKTQQLDALEKDYNHIMEKLNDIPLLMEYLDLQTEINDFLQIVNEKLNDTLMADLNNNDNK